jgi:hypothetical protein
VCHYRTCFAVPHNDFVLLSRAGHVGDARNRSADSEQSATGKLRGDPLCDTLSCEIGVDSEGDLLSGALDHSPKTGPRRYDVVGVGL